MGLMKKLFGKTDKPSGRAETPEERKKREDEEALQSTVISAGNIVN